MNRVIKILGFLLLACLSLSLMAGCTVAPTVPSAPNDGEPGHQEQPDSNISSSPADRVDVVYFHRTQRCRKCTYAEEATRYTLETYFKDELASGRVTFQAVDVQDEENADVVEKYDASYLSLFINTVRDGTDHIEEVTGIWRVVGDDESFVELVKSKVEQSLSGEA